MKVTIKGTSSDNQVENIEMTLEHLGETKWEIKVGKVQFTVSEIEQAMEFLKKQESHA